jgi:MFS family permease
MAIAVADEALATGLDRQTFRRIMVASSIGNILEWYDFFLYSFAAALVIGQLFFPAGTDPLVGTLGAFAGFALGFLARPIGGIIFGHVGDRYGRKSALVTTFILMGIATFLMGLVPVYAQIGIWAPLAIVILRILQGIANGGEWGGPALIVTENVSPERRGYYSSWPQMGLSAGFVLAAVAFYLSQYLTGDAFLSWGWRFPFLISIVIFFTGVFIRYRIPESVAFRRMEERSSPPQLPILEVIKRQPKQILIAMGLRVAENGSSYIFLAFSIAYAKSLGISADTVLLAIIVAMIIVLPVIIWFGALADKISPRLLYMSGALGVMVFAFPFFMLIASKNTFAIYAALIIAICFCFAPMTALQPKMFSELFSTEVRYSGLALGHEVSAAFAGGLSPLIATALLLKYGSYVPVAFYLMFLGAVTVVTILVTRASRLTQRIDLVRSRSVEAR